MMKGLLSWGVLTRLFLLYSCDSHASTAPHSPHPHSHSATGPHGKGRSTGLGAGAVAVMSVTTESDAYSHIGIAFVGHPTPMRRWRLMTSRRWHHANDDLEATVTATAGFPTHTCPFTRQCYCYNYPARDSVSTHCNAISDRPLWDSGWVQSSAQALQWPSTMIHRLTSNSGLCTLCPPTNVVDSGVALVARIQHC
jgi:hypothetical protein